MQKKYVYIVLGIIGGVIVASLIGKGMVQSSRSETQEIIGNENYEVATLASGCFWCMEATMQETTGVVAAVSGYAGGKEVNPTYEDVYKDKTGHREAVQVTYDPTIISYEQILDLFWQNIDPVDGGGQFVDRGFSYTTAIFYHDDAQQKIAEATRLALEESDLFDKPIATKIEPFTTFYEAEEYHQDFYKKSKTRYKSYEGASGRKEYKEQIWKEIQNEQSSHNTVRMATKKYEADSFEKPSKSELKESLTDLQYKVTQKEGTERPFNNEYWDNHADGIYVDIVSGEPLFSSTDKYDSGTGWPSFLKPIDKSFVTEHSDYKLIVPRTEIRSAIADSHLGHIIMDGPESNDRVRYCMNSASMTFVPVEKMEELGYEEYLTFFK